MVTCYGNFPELTYYIYGNRADFFSLQQKKDFSLLVSKKVSSSIIFFPVYILEVVLNTCVSPTVFLKVVVNMIFLTYKDY